MRGTRWLLLAAIVMIVVGLGYIYRARKDAMAAEAPVKPAALPEGLNSTASDYCFSESTAAYTKAEVCADIQEAQESGQVDLKKVVLKLHNRNGKTYDLVTSDAAVFFKNERRMYSEGEVQITLDVPEEGTPAHTLVAIKSSGVTFETGTGRVETDRPASFVLPNGAGQARGAIYDSTLRQLTMKNDVVLDWKSAHPRAKAMRIEAGGVEYREAASEILLMRGAKLARENSVVEGENATLKLVPGQDGNKIIRDIHATKAHGTDIYPRRTLEYSAGELWVALNDEGEAEKVTAQTNARLQSTSDSSETTMTANHVDMHFAAGAHESELTAVNGTGDAVVTAKPLPAPNRQLPETHVLRSQTIEMKMRPGGREIENVVVPQTGVLEFLPNSPAQHHRTLDGSAMVIVYGVENRVQSFRASAVRTQTDPNAEELKRKRKPSITTSRTMSARFDPKTNRMISMEQEGNFAYEEGDRKASAARATLDAQDVMVLDTSASMSDSAGATSADRIRIDQRADTMTAEGNVRSSRLPDKTQKQKSSEMFTNDELLLAQAAKMETKNQNRNVHYEGGAMMWQGANRIQADTIDLDREKRTLVADGKVVTTLWEGQQEGEPKKTAPPVVTEVHAAHMVYTEQDRLAVYTGGIDLRRTGLHVTGRELRAWLSDTRGDSRLVKAFADGNVEVLQKTPQHTRTGWGEHSEYYTEDQKIILRGNRAKFVDSEGKVTDGDELTYYANDARLLVHGSPKQPAISRIKTAPKAKREPSKK